MNDNQVTTWIGRLKKGDVRATEIIWQIYFEKLVRLARRRLGEIPRRTVDEEDVALSAMNSVIRGVELGRFPKLDDRNDLWRILVTITARKAVKQQRRHFAEKRGGGKVSDESIFTFDDSSGPCGIDQILDQKPTAEFASELSCACDQMLEILNDDKLEAVVRFKLEGFSNKEIAQKLECSSRTIVRKLELIRDMWSRAS